MIGFSRAAALVDVSGQSFSVCDPSQPLLVLDDMASHRGDGIFETVLATYSEDGSALVHNRGLHFERFVQSAHALELPRPDFGLWNAALDATVKAFKGVNPEATSTAVRYTLSRGLDSEGEEYRAHGWVLAMPADEPNPAGITIVTLDSGLTSHFAGSAPWLLRGAKTLSYATNLAADRYAREHGAQDALFYTSDGYILEGPTSTFVMRMGDRLITPDPKIGILHGTTQRRIFERAATHGYTTEYASVSLDDLGAADAAWLVSSVRICRPITRVLPTTSGSEVNLSVDHELTESFMRWVLDSE